MNKIESITTETRIKVANVVFDKFGETAALIAAKMYIDHGLPINLSKAMLLSYVSLEVCTGNLVIKSEV